MAISLSKLTPKINSRHRRKVVGRGNASGHGCYSCRGLKGQRARTGGKRKLKLMGFKTVLRRIPKLGGFKSIYPKLVVINLDILEKKFSNEATIDPEKLVEIGLVKKMQKSNGIKILGNGKLTKKFIIKAQAFSKSATEAIEKAGGQAIKIQ
ncbi:MAG: 50S ribosomal protein L15 [Patescibacteria group bacterium]|jgi:large subunit ribosomal protein L15|nr:50S ribosomal protein L15 [Patescibacteria group bacterium]